MANTLHIIPDLMLPQLSTLTDKAPEGDEWVHEIKYDGYRLLCRKDGLNIDFYTRRGHRWTDKFPSLVEAVSGIAAKSVWLDGELVVMKETGHSCYGSLQQAVWKRDQGCLCYYVFDIMYHNGRNICSKSLLTRKRLLAELLPILWNLKYIDFVRGNGGLFFDEACKQQLEGIVSKKVDSIYQPGIRSRDWLKVKCRGYSEVRNVASEWWKG